MEQATDHNDSHEMSPASIGRALDALRREWGHLYLTGHDDERGWWATRLDRTGVYLTADDPGALRQAMTDDPGPARSSVTAS
jgi:hypothetical protein